MFSIKLKLNVKLYIENEKTDELKIYWLNFLSEISLKLPESLPSRDHPY